MAKVESYFYIDLIINSVNISQELIMKGILPNLNQ